MTDWADLMRSAWGDAWREPAASAMSGRELLGRIRHFSAVRKLSRSRLAIIAGLHPNTLRGMHCPGWRPNFETVEKLESVIAAVDAGRIGLLAAPRKGRAA